MKGGVKKQKRRRVRWDKSYKSSECGRGGRVVMVTSCNSIILCWKFLSTCSKILIIMNNTCTCVIIYRCTAIMAVNLQVFDSNAPCCYFPGQNPGTPVEWAYVPDGQTPTSWQSSSTVWPNQVIYTPGTLRCALTKSVEPSCHT